MSIDSCCICQEKFDQEGLQSLHSLCRNHSTVQKAHKVCIRSLFFGQVEEKGALENWARTGQSPFYCPLCEKKITIKKASAVTGLQMRYHLRRACQLLVSVQQEGILREGDQMEQLLSWERVLHLMEDTLIDMESQQEEDLLDVKESFLYMKTLLEEFGRKKFLEWKNFLQAESIRDFSELKMFLRKLNAFVSFE